MVRLITHNILTCAVKNCVESGKNFPLNFKNVKSIEIHEQDFNKDFILSFYQKLDFDIVLNTLNDLGDSTLNDFRNFDINQATEDDLKKLHRCLLEMDITQGELVCNNCGHVYPINEGIPNMLLSIEEI